MITVVAIPQEGDRVWKVSSEKIPHLTLMVMDDIPNSSRIFDFIAHASTSLSRFGLNVDHRGVLGDKNADVLFFEENMWTEDLQRFRTNLLQNRDIFIAYNAVEQFPEWTPHLTLGYPATPAKPDNEDYPIGWVNFDRIAVWVGDFEGPEYYLEHDRYALSMTESSLDVLRHYGVLGMHWGKRKARKEAPRASNYNAVQQRDDIKAYGRAGSDRINERLSNGMHIDNARKAEVSYRRKRAALVIGGAYVAAMLATKGPLLAQGLANNYVAKKNVAAGAKAAANLLADSKGLGAHKIVDLGFNAATGVWG